MSQTKDAPNKSPPAGPPATDAKPAGGWRDPTRRRGFSLGVRGSYPAKAPTKP